jgi:NAD+ synthase (glutamine-hydrolysing)
MDGIIRLRLAVNQGKSGNPAECLRGIKAVLAGPDAADITVFPKLALCPPSSGSLMQSAGLAQRAEQALRGLLMDSKGRPGYLIVGLPMEDMGRVVSVMAVIHDGGVVALVQAADYGRFGMILPADTVFQCGRMLFSVLACDLNRLASQVTAAADNGADLIIVPAYSPVRAGFFDEVCASARTASRETGCAVAVVGGGAGDTSSPWLYGGFVAVYEGGDELLRSCGELGSIDCFADLDVDRIRAEKPDCADPDPSYHTIPAAPKTRLLRPIGQNPWLPEANPEAYLTELFGMQAASLATRMENTGIKKLAIAVSGGLDSAAALLVAARACDRLGLPRTNILGVTMPGLGTSGRTHKNAVLLLDALGVTAREIPIRSAVEGHFRDIGHSGQADAAYENAQARERTQIILDLANMGNALMVGPGDLSEAALGFTTFAGDHIANYNVNICIVKTLLRALTRHVATTLYNKEVAAVILDILDTPVSPELLPPGEGGDILQKTEDILGPYLLHDFFLYYYIRYRLPPSKLLAYASAAFAGELEPAYIREKLRFFYKKLAAGQFKRAAAPDAASITEYNLLGVNHYFPSDFDARGLLWDLAE